MYRDADILVPGEELDEWSEGEWREHRENYLGASEAAAILGIHKYKTALEVWAEKTGEMENDFDGNYSSDLGEFMEPFLREKFEENQGLEVNEANDIICHPDHEFLATNLDSWVTEEQVPAELKNSRVYLKEAWEHLEETGEPQEGTMVESYFVQLQHQLMVTGAPYGFLVANCDNHLFVIRIPREEELCSHLEEQLVGFWDYVQKGEKPDIEAVDPGVASELYPLTEEEESLDVQDGSEVDKMMDEYLDVHERIKDLKERKDELQAQLKQVSEGHKIVESSHARANRVAYTFESAPKSKLKEFMKENHPDKYEEMKEEQSRDFFRVSSQ